MMRRLSFDPPLRALGAHPPDGAVPTRCRLADPDGRFRDFRRNVAGPARRLGLHAYAGLSILIFLAALVAWIEPRGLALAFVIGALTTVQVFLPEIDNRWIAGLHPVNALLIFLLALVLLWRVRAIPVSRPASPSA
jgi:hypothetical protein